MSSTNRGGSRSPADYYPTPHWCVRRLLEEVELPGGTWVEPCAGEGDIVEAVDRVKPGLSWVVNELRPACRPRLEALVGTDAVSIGDTLAWQPPRVSVAITNPPFRVAQPMVGWCRAHAEVAVLLLRLNFVGTLKRSAFMRAHPPDVYVLPNRPSFTGKGTDSVEYAWFVWDGRRQPEKHGRLQVLAATPPDERRRG